MFYANSNSANVPGMATVGRTPAYQPSHDKMRATFLAPTPLVLKTRRDVVGQKHGVGVGAVWRATVDLASLLERLDLLTGRRGEGLRRLDTKTSKQVLTPRVAAC